MPPKTTEPPAINGFLNLYKPVGITSMEAVRRVKRITRQRKKVGHAGTLDPLAEGVLPICFGQGTRLMEQVVSGRKRYRMTMRLGASSTTYDAEGTIAELADPSWLTRRDIAATLIKFVGRIDQVPPMYSAIKVEGKRLYELARTGQDIERKSRQVDVYTIQTDCISLPFLTLTIDCGRGTYLRSIAHDLGLALGCGAYVTSLHRLSCGQFKHEDSVTLDMLEQASTTEGWLSLLHPVDWSLRDCPAVTLTSDDEQAIRHGQAIDASAYCHTVDTTRQWRAYSPDGKFLAILQYEINRTLWQPTRVFRNEIPSPYAPPSSTNPILYRPENTKHE